MKRGILKRYIIPALFAGSTLFTPSASANVKINEFSTDPKIDYNSNGFINDNDEFVEFYNASHLSRTLDNWTLKLIDTTPEELFLEGTIPANSYRLLLNLPGNININDNGRLELYNELEELVDSVTFGNWDDGNTTDNAPDGDSHSFFNDSLSRYPNITDTNNDALDFIKTRSTPGFQNVPEPQTILLLALPLSLYALARKRKHKHI